MVCARSTARWIVHADLTTYRGLARSQVVWSGVTPRRSERGVSGRVEGCDLLLLLLFERVLLKRPSDEDQVMDSAER